MSAKLNRREFVKRGAGYAAALAGAALAPAARTASRPAASDRLRIGFIGCGGRAHQLMRIFRQFGDPDASRLLSRPRRKGFELPSV